MNNSILHTVPHRFFPGWASKTEPDGSSATWPKFPLWYPFPSLPWRWDPDLDLETVSQTLPLQILGHLQTWAGQTWDQLLGTEQTVGERWGYCHCRTWASQTEGAQWISCPVSLWQTLVPLVWSVKIKRITGSTHFNEVYFIWKDTELLVGEIYFMHTWKCHY